MGYSWGVNDVSVGEWAGLIVIAGIVCFFVATIMFRMGDYYRDSFSLPPLRWLVSIAFSCLVAYLLFSGI
jgi:hypothetical protein